MRPYTDTFCDSAILLKRLKILCLWISFLFVTKPVLSQASTLIESKTSDIELGESTKITIKIDNKFINSRIKQEIYQGNIASNIFVWGKVNKIENVDSTNSIIEAEVFPLFAVQDSSKIFLRVGSTDFPDPLLRSWPRINPGKMKQQNFVYLNPIFISPIESLYSGKKEHLIYLFIAVLVVIGFMLGIRKFFLNKKPMQLSSESILEDLLHQKNSNNIAKVRSTLEKLELEKNEMSDLKSKFLEWTFCNPERKDNQYNIFKNSIRRLLKKN